VEPSAVGNDGRQTNERCHHVRTYLLRRLGELEASRAMAAAVGNGDTTLLHVWSPPAEQLADSFSTRDADTRLSADLELVARTRAREIIEQGVEVARGLGIGVDARDERSGDSIWQTILDLADREDASLIVVGNHGTTAVQDGAGERVRRRRASFRALGPRSPRGRCRGLKANIARVDQRSH
jgi:nucleotide-binding universal stress UspA family protein